MAADSCSTRTARASGGWLSEAPLYPILVGLVFRLVIAPGVAADLEEEEAER